MEEFGPLWSNWMDEFTSLLSEFVVCCFDSIVVVVVVSLSFAPFQVTLSYPMLHKLIHTNRQTKSF